MFDFIIYNMTVKGMVTGKKFNVLLCILYNYHTAFSENTGQFVGIHITDTVALWHRSTH